MERVSLFYIGVGGVGGGSSTLGSAIAHCLLARDRVAFRAGHGRKA